MIRKKQANNFTEIHQYLIKGKEKIGALKFGKATATKLYDEAIDGANYTIKVNGYNDYQNQLY